MSVSHGSVPAGPERSNARTGPLTGPLIGPPTGPLADPDTSVDGAADAFRAANLPFTVQRRAIWESIRGSADHPTADDVCALVAQRLSGVSRTTVYRTLEAMVRIGLLARVGHPRSAVRYDPRTTRHHHLICEGCGAVIDYEDDALDSLPLPSRAPKDFQVRDFSVQLVGRCAECRAHG